MEVHNDQYVCVILCLLLILSLLIRFKTIGAQLPGAWDSGTRIKRLTSFLHPGL